MKNLIVITLAIGALALTGTAEEAENSSFGSAMYSSK